MSWVGCSEYGGRSGRREVCHCHHCCGCALGDARDGGDFGLRRRSVPMVAARWGCSAFRASFTAAAAVTGAEGGKMRLKLLREGRVERISMGSPYGNSGSGKCAKIVASELRGCRRIDSRRGALFSDTRLAIICGRVMTIQLQHRVVNNQELRWPETLSRFVWRSEVELACFYSPSSALISAPARNDVRGQAARARCTPM
jgi:hypothetical protein